MSAWTRIETAAPIVLHHIPTGKFSIYFVHVDSWGRKVYEGPQERWPQNDPRYIDRMNPEPCDDSHAPDGCRQRWMHTGAHTPTPEDIMGPNWTPRREFTLV